MHGHLTRGANATCTVISSNVVCRDFIGRTIELQFLLDRVMRLRDGHGGSLFVKGSAGIGKSRLVRELVTAATDGGITTVQAACGEIGESPFAPILRLADALGIDQLEIAGTAVADPATMPYERSRRLAATASAFKEAAKRRPFLAVVEDVHWASPAALELLRLTIASLKGLPAVFVLTERGDESAADTVALRTLELLERDADATLTLDSLSPSEIKALIASALRDDGRRISTVVADEISTLSDGRPFHAEELLRGLLERTTGTEAPAEPRVPRSVRAAVIERLALFDAGEREVLANAAVIGTRFAIRLLAKIAERGERDLLPTLRKARNAQLIVEEPSGDAFAFRHALTREVVYEEILRTEARALHARIAQELIDEDGEPIHIAHHAWRSGDPTLTYTWNVRCGEAAAALFAHVDAIRHYHRAFSCAHDDKARSATAERIAEAYYSTGELPASLTWYETAIAYEPAASERAHRLALDKARVLFENGDYDRGIDLANAVVSALDGIDSSVRFEAETRTAALLTTIGRFDEAFLRLGAAESLRATKEPRWAARHRGILARALHGAGRIEESAAAFLEAETASRAIGDLDLLERTLNNAACLKAACGDVAGAIATFHDALDVARRLQSSRLVAWVQQNLAHYYLFLGDFDRARAACAEARSIDHGVASVSRWLDATALRLETLTGNIERAEMIPIAQAMESAFDGRDDLSAAVTAGAAILYAQMRGDAGNAIAERYLERTVRAEEPWIADAAAGLRPDLAARIRARFAEAAAPPYALGLRASLALLDARCALRARRRAEADEHAKSAVEQFKALGWPLHEAYAREVRGHVKEAADIFRRVGAHAELARVTNVDVSGGRRRGETTLTLREREIATQIAAGKTNREVAEALVISERTVETHVASIYGKLGVCNRRELTALLGPSA